MKQRFKKGDVIVVQERPAYISRIGGDYGDTSTIHYEFINSDGTLSPGHRFQGEYAVPEGTKHIDLAEARIVVTLPPEWKTRAIEFERAQSEAEASKRLQSGEWRPETHPAYGTVQVNRVSGYTALFGSPFKHMHYINLNIGRATLNRSHGYDRIYGGFHGDLITIAFSEAQWARILSSIGQGEGVPCTIQRLAGKAMEDCPDQAEINRFHEDIERATQQSAAFLDEALTLAQALLDDKAPTKAKRIELASKLKAAQQKLVDAAPFIAKQLHERMDTVVQEGKTEIEAFAQRTLVDAGLKKLAETCEGSSAVIALPALTQNKPGTP